MSTSVEAAVVLREGLAEHPASRAWSRLRRSRAPSEIRVLKEPAKASVLRRLAALLGEAWGWL